MYGACTEGKVGSLVSRIEEDLWLQKSAENVMVGKVTVEEMGGYAYGLREFADPKVR